MMMRQQITGKTIIEYGTAGVVLFVGVGLGFFMVMQSKANNTVLEPLVPGSPLAIQGPSALGIEQGFPVVPSSDTVTNFQYNNTNYALRIRQDLEKMLLGVQESCGFEQTVQAIEHIRATMQSTSSLAVSDTWCLTDSLTKIDESTEIIATKLPFIKLLARHHAGSDNHIREQVRTLPLNTEFEDSEERGAWSQYIIYAQAYGLLDRVTASRLEPLQQINQLEYQMLLDMKPSDKRISMEDLIGKRLQDKPDLLAVQYVAGSNELLIKGLLRAIEGKPQKQQRALVEKIVYGMKNKANSSTKPLEQWLEGLLYRDGI